MKDNEETTSQLALKLQAQALALKAKREAEREAYRFYPLIFILPMICDDVFNFLKTFSYFYSFGPVDVSANVRRIF